LIERDLEKLARAESIDTGKPLSLARILDIPRAASNFRFFATAILSHRIGSAYHGQCRFQLHAANSHAHRRTHIAVESSSLFVEPGKSRQPSQSETRPSPKPSELTPMTAYMLCGSYAKPGCRMRP